MSSSTEDKCRQHRRRDATHIYWVHLKGIRHGTRKRYIDALEPGNRSHRVSPTQGHLPLQDRHAESEKGMEEFGLNLAKLFLQDQKICVRT